MNAENKRRYYLHRKLKKYFNIQAHKRIITIPEQFEIPALYDKYLTELKQLKYTVQLKMNI